MISLSSGITSIVGLAFVVLFALLMVVLLVIKRPRPGRDLRSLRAFSRLRRALSLTVEAGTRFHISLGRGEITHPRTASAFVGLSAAHRLVEATAVSDRPAIISAGTGPLGMLARSTLHSAYAATQQEDRYRPIYGCVTGLTPFAYAAGAMLAARDEDAAANFFSGSFGAEVALMADGLEGEGTLTVAGTESVAGQAVLYAAADEPLVGEEVFASGAYLNAGALHGTSLLTQDIFRWLIIVAIVGGAIVKMLGVVP